jgi:hypothetical protein
MRDIGRSLATQLPPDLQCSCDGAEMPGAIDVRPPSVHAAYGDAGLRCIRGPVGDTEVHKEMDEKRSTDTGTGRSDETTKQGGGMDQGGTTYQPGQGGSGGGGYQPGQSEMPGGQTYHPRQDQPETGEDKKGTGTPETES